MNSANKLNAYRVNAVSTASAENLVVMLYDGAIRFMGMAIRAFDKEDPLDFNLAVHTNITKAQATAAAARWIVAVADRFELPSLE